MDEITVIYSVYGEFDEERLLLSIASVLEQKDVALSIIVSEENRTSKIHNRISQPKVQHIFTKTPINNNMYNPGKIRNRALARVQTDYVYTCDADIIFKDQHFFKNLLSLCAEDTIFIQPPLKRVLIGDAKKLIQKSKQESIRSLLPQLYYPSEHIASFQDHDPGMILFGKKEYKYTISLEDYIAAKRQELPFAYFTQTTVHAGTLFGKVEYFRNVGGYAECFANWGGEDTDLQWKLAKDHRMIKIPNTEQFIVLHLDHNKEYINTEATLQNQRILQERKKTNFASILKDDRKQFKKHLDIHQT